MKKYTAIYAHLEYPSELKIHDKVNPGDKIGVMGSSGQSTGAHLHFGCVTGHHNKIVTLGEITSRQDIVFAGEQGLFFVDEDMFKIAPVVTTHALDPEYYKKRGKHHWGWDLVPEDRHESCDHFSIYWNRSKIGTVLGTCYHETGYGHLVLVGFEA